LPGTGGPVSVVVQLKGDFHKTPQNLAKLPIHLDKEGKKGVVPLDQLATVQVSHEPAEIRHSDLARVCTVRVNVEGREPAAVLGDIEKSLKGLSMPDGLWVKIDKR